MAIYYVYENWTVSRARIHFASCAYCNDGKGVHPDAGDRNGQWHGPFLSFHEAREAADKTGQPVSECKACCPI